ncbi:AraC family transcriptional regulator [Janthinobacterium agaricidamnosum]|uniref:Bacterial regulatory helix-turn-helix s, AraC family protein n=1 Tax=Janthinobacterium agaricidamnosum NBRC 102515 = DSM 9628 TaxID=1349767 RepID=W0V8D4_9BURK|nr:AraC family transcriptional regulator [Janthinobacterium agaricidamnosum]CDG83517.1 bacterial regulatory helix-turn-helix s, AraC family protein [Janthinobacterium agaricidamnosum NBRC 102515 = DSM 9628]
MDALSRLLSLHPVHTALNSRCVLGVPSRMEHLAQSHGVAPYHLIVSGSVNVHISGGDAVTLHAGDVILFPQGHAHSLQAGMVHATGAGTEILCGQFHGASSAATALMAALPHMVLIRTAGRSDLAGLGRLILLLHDEAAQSAPGAEAVIFHLASALFSLLLRSWLRQSSHLDGLFALLAEPRLAPALQRMLSAPGAACSIDQMASACSLSRTTFMRLFRLAAGMGPAQVLQRLRMAQAEQWLASSRQSIGQIADVVGYQSEASFNRAFKRRTGVGPGEYRRRVAQLDSDGHPRPGGQQAHDLLDDLFKQHA